MNTSIDGVDEKLEDTCDRPTMKQPASLSRGVVAWVMTVGLMAMVACSGSDESETTQGPDASMDGSPMDTEPPSFRDVSASIQGEFSSQVDLNESATRVLPVPAMTTFTVFADDNETPAEKLSVEVVDADGQALSGQSSSFSNGLWTITVELSPDTQARIRAVDSAGNAATTQTSLDIPSQAEALVDEWQRRTYTNDDQSIDARYDLTVGEDGTWEEVRPEVTLGGEYSVDGETLRFSRTYLSSGDTNRETIERQVRSGYYVDGTYMHRSPWTREDGSDSSDDIAGTWVRSYEVYTPTDGNLELQREVNSTLEFERHGDSENTWTRTRSGTEYTGTQGSSFTSTASGTWEIVENESYGGNFGDYLVRTTTREDGSSLETPRTTAELFHMSLDKLLLSPYLDIDE